MGLSSIVLLGCNFPMDSGIDGGYIADTKDRNIKQYPPHDPWTRTTMESTPHPKQYPVKIRQDSPSPGWATTLFQGSECEYLRDYTDGGLCPVHIDDVINGSDLLRGEEDEERTCSFRIIGKLGRGSYSTVWLGRET